MAKFDLVLINTPFYNYRQKIRLGLLTLASYARKQGFSVTILDGHLKAIKKHLAHLDLNGSLVGMTATTDVVLITYELCDFVKSLQPDALCVLGGFHTTVLPERTLRESNFNLVVIGEGELTLIEILQTLQGGVNLSRLGEQPVSKMASSFNPPLAWIPTVLSWTNNH